MKLQHRVQGTLCTRLEHVRAAHHTIRQRHTVLMQEQPCTLSLLSPDV
jgi:hypothetical protein